MTCTDAATLSSSFSAAANNIHAVAAQISNISGIAETINETTHIFLTPDQIIHVGDTHIQASELILMQRLLKETYPEEYL